MKKKLYASPDKKICGVCAGIADYFNVDPTIVRVAVVAIACITAIIPALIVYFVVALVLPKPPENYYQIYNNTSKRITKSNDKKICGVCGGIAEYFRVDPTIIRLIFALVMLFFGYGLVIYIACAIIFPSAPEYDNGYYSQQQYAPGTDGRYYEQNYQQQEPQDPNGFNNGDVNNN